MSTVHVLLFFSGSGVIIHGTVPVRTMTTEQDIVCVLCCVFEIMNIIIKHNHDEYGEYILCALVMRTRPFRCLYEQFKLGAHSQHKIQIKSIMSVSERVAKRVAERNSWDTFSEPTIGKLCKMLRVGFAPSEIPSQAEIDKVFPIAKVNWESLRKPPDDKIQSTWIGHASVMVQMAGFNIITDPIFSKRCSAVQFAGPARYRDPAFTIEDICVAQDVGIDVILISHNHYDHLDYNSVRELASTAIKTNRPVQFVVALGLKKWFKSHVPKSMQHGNKVDEIDWHETFTIDGKGKDGNSSLEITGIPMQHWSNRNGFDKDKSLWCGFALKGAIMDGSGSGTSLNYLFSGDTGFFDGLYDVGKRYGPFDLAAIPIGAYAPRWFMEPMHTDPEDAVKMMDAVQVKRAFAIHWGTFPLTIEPILEPRERLEEELDKVGKDKSTFVTTLIGETVTS